MLVPPVAVVKKVAPVSSKIVERPNSTTAPITVSKAKEEKKTLPPPDELSQEMEWGYKFNKM